ncbi:MAG TPA: hypothetical protein VF516_28445 [Kofleriaceae bacterium]
MFLSVLTFGCTTRAGDRVDGQGIAELRVGAASLGITGITRVTVQSADVSQDLVFHEDDSAYEGTVILPAGTVTLVASAFNGDALVGQSRPTPVEITRGAVTRVFLQILDLRQSGPPRFGPIFDSLSFPTTVTAGDVATFTIAVIAPAGDPVTYAWTSDCTDATFTAPDAATTGWSKPTQGICHVRVVATSNGLSVTQNFSIVVFPASDSGAVDVTAGFVFAPAVAFQISGAGCLALDQDASCPTPIASPTVVNYSLSVFSWNSFPGTGTFTVSDNCGGTFFPEFQNRDFVTGQWLPPVTAGICILTARAVNDPGAVTIRGAAIVVHAGTAP